MRERKRIGNPDTSPSGIHMQRAAAMNWNHCAAVERSLGNPGRKMAACVFLSVYKVIVCFLLGVTAILSPVLNAFVCVTIFRHKKFHTLGNILICNLAISDGIIGILLAPLELVYVSRFPVWHLGSVGTNVLNSIWLFSLVSPFVIVSVITVERYKTISSFTLAATREDLHTKKLTAVIAMMWLYSFIAVAIMAGNFSPAKSQVYIWNVKPEFYYPFLALHIVVPLCIVITAYCKIFQITKRMGLQEFEESVTSNKHLQSREVRLAKTVGIVIGLLFLVWLPVLVIECFYATESSSCVTEAAGPLSVWLTVFSGVMNPVVYFYRNPGLRMGFLQVICRSKGYASSQMTDRLLAVAGKESS